MSLDAVDQISRLSTAAIDDLVAAHDPSGFYRLLEDLPQQSRDAWAAAHAWPMPANFRRPSRVVLIGMGGSAIGADIVATIGRLHGRVPIEVVRQYDPPIVDANALVIACSFSGNTEETVTAFTATLTTPGMRLALTAGGNLADLAREAETPLITYTWDGPPRTAIGYGLFIILGLLVRLDAIDIDEDDVNAAIAGMQEAAERYGLHTSPNEAKRLATEMGNRLPVIIGADFLEVAAHRFATEVSENAKQWAFSTSLPEFNHNTLQALASPDGTPSALLPIILDAPAVHARVRRRASETLRMLTDYRTSAEIVNAGGDTPLEAIVRAASLGSWTSYYLAMLRGVDPWPVSVLDEFKQRMARD